jgi:hypothetical protein
MTMSDYLCKDCNHAFVKPVDAVLFLFDWNNKYRYTCRKSFQPKSIEPDPVVGTKVNKGGYDSCSAYRIRSSDCGPTAQYWEPKHKRDLFKFMQKVEDERQS